MLTRQELMELIDNDDNVAAAAIVAIYKLQTNDEKNAGVTISENGVGFNSYDAVVMTPIAKKIKNGEMVTWEEFGIGRQKIKKYWKQLLELNKKKEEKKNEKRSSGYISIGNSSDVAGGINSSRNETSGCEKFVCRNETFEQLSLFCKI